MTRSTGRWPHSKDFVGANASDSRRCRFARRYSSWSSSRRSPNTSHCALERAPILKLLPSGPPPQRARSEGAGQRADLMSTPSRRLTITSQSWVGSRANGGEAARAGYPSNIRTRRSRAGLALRSRCLGGEVGPSDRETRPLWQGQTCVGGRVRLQSNVWATRWRSSTALPFPKNI